MTRKPTALADLLAAEIAKHLPAIESGSSNLMDARAALHALRGSAGMAGESDLALVLGQLGARVREGAPGARERVVALLEESSERLRAGRRALPTAWPVPPIDLAANTIAEAVPNDYHAAQHERLSELDRVAGEGPRVALDRIRIAVHAMKGAALAMSDEVTAWYLHGFEGAIDRARADDSHSAPLVDDLGQHRAILATLLDDPADALLILAARSGDERSSPRTADGGPARARRPTDPPPGALRVPTEAVEGLLARVERLEFVHDELARAADTLQESAGSLRDLRGSLFEALRLIGPPRPFGTPVAAVSRVQNAARVLLAEADRTDAAAVLVRRGSRRVQGNARAAVAALSAFRRTTARDLFDRVSRAVGAAAGVEGKRVRVVTDGEDTAIDRDVAERLLDPLVQLATNAVAHGIATPDVRRAASKSTIGVVSLSARPHGPWVRLVVADDGEGIDPERILTRARQLGLIGAGTPVEPTELLGLLFVPGLSTRESAELLAGRGLGLDVVQSAVTRLGGAVRLAPHPLGGLGATIDVPSEARASDVLWVTACGTPFALPVAQTGRVTSSASVATIVHLGTCLGLSGPREGPIAIELSVEGLRSIGVAVDAVGEIEEATIRQVPSLIAAVGPYSGAILRSDGALRLVLDAARLASRALSIAA